VYQYREPTATLDGSNPPSGYAVDTLLDKQVSLKTAGCPTEKLSSPPPIDPAGYLVLRVEIDHKGDNTAFIYLGRVTVTLTP
jgi:hypothetical protein